MQNRSFPLMETKMVSNYEIHLVLTINLLNYKCFEAVFFIYFMKYVEINNCIFKDILIKIIFLWHNDDHWANLTKGNK